MAVPASPTLMPCRVSSTGTKVANDNETTVRSTTSTYSRNRLRACGRNARRPPPCGRCGASGSAGTARAKSSAHATPGSRNHTVAPSP